MEKKTKVIILTIICVFAVEFMIYLCYSAIKKYDNLYRENIKLRRELRECRNDLAKYENKSDYQIIEKAQYYCTAKKAQ